MQYLRAFRVRRALLAPTLALILLAFIPARLARAAAGDLDLTFGTGGKVFNAGAGGVTALALQSDDRIITVSGIGIGTTDFYVQRFTKDGFPDPTFGVGGGVKTDFNGRIDLPGAVALQGNGKIVVAGRSLDAVAGNVGVVIARYNADGSPDTTFGVAGKVLTDYAGTYLHEVTAVTVQGDGKVVVAGFIAVPGGGSVNGLRHYILWRYNADGSPDSSFGAGGSLINLFGTACVAYAVKIDPSGKILVAGGAFEGPLPGNGDQFLLARHNPDGSLDQSFGTGGMTFGGPVQPFGAARDLVIQGDGKLVAAGGSFAVARYNSNGSIDTSFGGGEVRVNFFSIEDFARAVVVQADGRIILGGTTRDLPRFADFSSSHLYFALARLNSNGSLDTTFGTGGKVTTDFSFGPDEIFALGLQSSGKLIAGGYGSIADGPIILARYLTSDFDLCLQDDSNGNRLQINSATGEYLFANCNGLTLGGVGTITRRGSTITLQHNSGDRRVLATVDTSTYRARASVQSLTSGKLFSLIDRNTTDNTCACR